MQTERSELFARDWFCVGRVEEASRTGSLAERELEATSWDFYQYLSRSLTPAKRSIKQSD